MATAAAVGVGPGVASAAEDAAAAITPTIAAIRPRRNSASGTQDGDPSDTPP
jgi:hypothetical protein